MSRQIVAHSLVLVRIRETPFRAPASNLFSNDTRAGMASLEGMVRSMILVLGLLQVAPTAACDLALVLAVDVSGSVDQREYEIQMQGLAEALRDGTVIDALVDAQAMVTLIQWTGSSRQRQTVPWVQMRTETDVAALAAEIGADKRVWRNYSTAVGEALVVAEAALKEALHCRRKVIDVSGDGVSNEGIEPSARHAELSAMGITVNALAIETGKEDLTGWFYENLILGEGAFVMTADGFEDYPVKIRRKLQRETTRQISASTGGLDNRRARGM
jgi:Ca-activated chloride channel family protein